MDQNIYLIGLNHKSAGVDVRERYALTNIEEFEKGLLDMGIREVMALSTCNRVEIIVVCSEEFTENEILSYWADKCGGSKVDLEPNTYCHKNLKAVNHLFRVASSLDSMIVGEPQILGQLKDSYRKAVEAGAARVIINRMLHKSFFVAKRVRSETSIASNAVSISYAAVELAKKIFGELKGQKALLIGAGEMAELAATHLLNSGVETIRIANRTFSRAEELAKTMNGKAIPFEALYDCLSDTDIIISSTGAPHAVIKAKDMKKVIKQRKFRPMFFIDIAVPRDIDPDVNGLDNVYLYDIDDLKDVVEENMAQREDEAVKANSIVESETLSFGNWINSLDLQPTIVDLFDRSEGVARKELAKTLKRLGKIDIETQEAIETMALSIGKKLLHEPVSFLKRRTEEEGAAEKFVDLARRMFNLDNDTIPPDAHCRRKKQKD
ncbi:glutamyl-tRNA reductase [Maridesulfovibrio ferrireducens]|uniref:glutamyl-tRNA reductase n=1 Tax=Maridesulfovibrio ferrireducens TaxID=246191 RepID=UPI001A25A790|nr:glutamyl-tRNA reductase [Maridesulfovibrio ferrireducens]MBI9111386.1 glutamyl-tRNA reductase [Maridesulfovibrio ferrireducens]